MLPLASRKRFSSDMMSSIGIKPPIDDMTYEENLFLEANSSIRMEEPPPVIQHLVLELDLIPGAGSDPRSWIWIPGAAGMRAYERVPVHAPACSS